MSAHDRAAAEWRGGQGLESAAQPHYWPGFQPRSLLGTRLHYEGGGRRLAALATPRDGAHHR